MLCLCFGDYAPANTTHLCIHLPHTVALQSSSACEIAPDSIEIWEAIYAVHFSHAHVAIGMLSGNIQTESTNLLPH